MEPFEQAKPEGPGSNLTTRLLSLAEVICVALLGNIVIALMLVAWGLELTWVLSSARNLCTFLLAESFFTLLLIRVLLGARERHWRWLSPRLGDASDWMVGLLALPLLLLVVGATALTLERLAPEWVSRSNPLLELLQTPTDFALFLITSIFVGGVKEEVQRAFVLRHFQTQLGGGWLGLLLWSLFFGWGHLEQGADKALQAGILGLLFGLLYLWRRSLVAPVVCHALYDIVVSTAWFLTRD